MNGTGIAVTVIILAAAVVYFRSAGKHLDKQVDNYHDKNSEGKSDQ